MYFEEACAVATIVGIIVGTIVYIVHARKKLSSYRKKIEEIQSKKEEFEEKKRKDTEDRCKMNNLVRECVIMRFIHPELKGKYWRRG